MKRNIHLASFLCSLVMTSCGSSSNPYYYLLGEEHSEAYDVYLTRARAAFNAGAYEEAQGFAEAAEQLNPGSEDAALLLGYVYLGLAGVAPFDILVGLAAQEEEEEASEESSDSSGEGSNETLDKLKGAVAISDDEFALLGELNTSVSDLPVIVPICAGEARVVVEKLRLVNQAIALACPYVNEEARLAEDFRHECDAPIKPAQKSSQANSLWAFAHLTEALAFHSVLTYSTIANAEDKTNLELRADRLKNTNVSDPREIAAYLSSVDELTEIVDKVMPVSGFCSESYPQAQFQAMINDLLSVSAAFKGLEGIPESLTESLDKSLEDIQDVRDNASGVDSSAQQASAARGDFTKDIAASVSEQIEEIPAGSLTEDEKSDLCSSYEGLLGSGSDAEPPSLCN
ncbi:MAG: hypothetical protein AB8C84_08550 [Oligoflexales bacterium]